MKKAILILSIAVLLIGCFVFAASAKEADRTLQTRVWDGVADIEFYGKAATMAAYCTHDYSHTVTKKPTTSATGTLNADCTICGHSVNNVTLPVLSTKNYSYFIREATCSSSGIETYTWKVTTYGTVAISNTLAKTAHNYSYKVNKAPTENEAGNLIGTCISCLASRNVTLPALNTSDYTRSEITPATCTSTGTAKYEWKITTYGKHSFTASIPAKGHSYTNSSIVAPTCTEQGYTLKKCTNSGCTYSIKTNDTAALGHDVVEETSESIEENCWVYITTTKKCTRCNEVFDRFNTQVLRHTEGAWITEEATCEAPGRMVQYCTVCRATLKEEVLPVKEHVEGETTTTPATCEEDGSIDTRCANCNALMYSTKIPAPGHNYKYDSKQANCTAEGYTLITCLNEGCELEEKTSIVPPLGHTGNYDVEKAATCVTDGLSIRHCTRCGDEKEKVIPKTGHMQTYYIEREATKTQEGIAVIKCKTCGYEFSRETIPCITEDSIYNTGNAIVFTVYLNRKGQSSTKVVNELATAARIDNEKGESYWVYAANNGTVTVDYEGGSLTAYAVGYRPRTYTEEMICSGRTTFYLDPETDEAPFIQSVMMNGFDLLHESYTLDFYDASTYVVIPEIDWGDSEYGSITITDGKSQVTLNNGATNVNWSEKLSFADTLTITAKDKNGNKCTRVLQLEKADYEVLMGGFSLDFPVEIEAELPEGTFMLGGQKIGMKIPEVGFEYCIENGKVYVAIGSETSGEVTGQDIKSFISRVKNKGLGLSKKKADGMFAFDCSVSVSGYMMGVIRSDGTIDWTQTGVIVEGSVGKDFSFPFMVGPVPAFVEVEVAASIRADMYLSDAAPTAGFNIDFEGDLSVSGGLGIGQADILSISGGAQGNLKPTWKGNADYSHFRLTASLALYAKVKVLFFEYKYTSDPIAEAVWIDVGSRRPTIVDPLADIDIYDANAYQLQDLSYLMEGSSFMPEKLNKKGIDAGSIQVIDFVTNAYEEAQPRIGAFSDGTMVAVWVGSVDSADVNGLQLFASYFDGASWSEPIVVEQDGTADANPQLTVIDDVAYIVWQDANSRIELTDGLDDIADKFDITMATFKPATKTFEVEAITCDEILDMMPMVCGEDGEAYVVWVNNTDNDLFVSSDANSILVRKISADGVGEAEVLYSTLPSVISMAVSCENGKLDVAYVADGDGNPETDGDGEVYLNGSALTNNEVTENNLVFYNGDLYWTASGDLMNAAGLVYSGINGEQLRVVETSNGRVVLFNKYDGLNATLYGLFYDNGTEAWGAPVALTDGVHAISAFSAVVDSDGMLCILASELKVEKEIGEEDPYGKTDIKLITVPLGVDIAISDICYDSAEYTEGNNMPFALNVTNNGGTTTKGVTVIVTDEFGAELNRNTFDVTLVPGASATLTYQFPVVDAQPMEHLYFTVISVEGEDCDETNSTADVVIDHKDITVEQINWGMNADEELVVSANIVNRRYSAMNGTVTVSLREDSENGTVLATKVIEGLDAMEVQRVSFLTKYAEEKVYFITIEATEGNSNSLNDADFVFVKGYNTEEYPETPVVDETVVIYHSLNLESDISLNYAVKAEQLEGAENYYLECVIPVYSGNTYTGNKMVKIEPVLNGSYYYFTLTGLSAIHMNDEMEAKLYFSRDGETFVSKADTYSIAQYAYSFMNRGNSSDVLKKLCAELLRYGASAQLYKEYRTDALADSKMTTEQKAYLFDLDTLTLNQCNEVLNDLENATIKWVGKTLVLDQKVELKYVFSLDGYDGDISDLTMQVNYVSISGETKTVTVGGAELYNKDRNLYAMTFDGLLAAELRVPVYVKIFSGDQQVSCTLKFSAESYGIGKTGRLGSLCKALIAYSDRAKEFYIEAHK